MFGGSFEQEDTTDTFMKKDTIFLALSFNLDSGSFVLKDSPVMESKYNTSVGVVKLEFNEVKLNSVWQPRFVVSSLKLMFRLYMMN